MPSEKNSDLLFSKETYNDFSRELSKEVKDYFANNSLNRYADSFMVIKMCSCLGVYLALYYLILSGYISLKYSFVLWGLLGVANVMIGTVIFHDAGHNNISKVKKINVFFSWLSGVLVGQSPRVWKLQHNRLHHAWPNIEGNDGDVHQPFLRLSPQQDWRWFHKYQVHYASFLYLFLNLGMVITRDFRKLVIFRKMNLIKTNNSLIGSIFGTVALKLVYFFIHLYIPATVLGVSMEIIIGMFLVMCSIEGLLLSLMFLPNHIMPSCRFPKDRYQSKNWHVHQLQNTTNHSPKNKLTTWVLGGLNFHIEHHLFPNICHTHLPDIADIVKTLTDKYNLGYNEKKSWIAAIADHYRMLYLLGNNRKIPPTPSR
jgi:linoleoyl-CoA desaturase